MHIQHFVFILSAFIVFACAQYSEAMGLQLCKVSLAAYCNPKRVLDWSCQPCKKSSIKLANIKPFLNDTGAAMGYIGTSSELRSIVLIFIGSPPDQVKNWLQDLTFEAVSYPLCDLKCKVHKGFYQNYIQLSSQLANYTNQFEKLYGFTNYIITGHSLGGAYATHAAAHLIKSKKNVQTLYTFGAPRIGYSSFADWFDSLFPGFKARVTHGKDPVPHLPPEIAFYKHFTTEIFYEGQIKKGFVVCKGQEDPKCSDKYKADTSLTDHLSYYDLDFSKTVAICKL